MKKIFLALFVLITSSLFAETYRVVSTTGNVFKMSNGETKKILVNDVLNNEDVVSIGLNSLLTLIDDTGHQKFIKQMSKGSVEDILSNKQNKKVLKSNTYKEVTTTTKGTATASTRASEAKTDYDWDEGDEW